MKKRILALVFAAAMALAVVGCGGTKEAAPVADVNTGDAASAEAAEEAPAVDEAAYIAYLHDFIDQCSATEGHEDEFYACADALDFETFPGDMFFNGMLGANAMTYDEFVAAGGVYEIPEEIKTAAAD